MQYVRPGPAGRYVRRPELQCPRDRDGASAYTRHQRRDFSGHGLETVRDMQ